MIAKWNNKSYRIINNVEIEKSSREVTYTDLTLDFSKCTMDDLPYAQQEIQIIDKNGNLKYTGFAGEYQLPELRFKGIKKELTLSLLSPRQLTTVRTVTVIRTATLEEILQQVLQVLYEDGFTLQELNIPDTTVTVKLISRTIEEVLNYLSNKYSLYWNIDEFKRITINSIDYQFSKPVSRTINIDNYKDMKGFIKLTPSVQNSDYANIINVKNARIFYELNSNMNVTLKNGDRVDFENPIDISYETGTRVAGELYTQGATRIVENLWITYNTNQSAYIVSNFNAGGTVNNGLEVSNIGTDDSSGALFVLTMDSTFKNLATGFTYKGENNITITSIRSETALRYANMKLINWQEINKNAGKITVSGQIERTVDVENGWFTKEELIDYVRSLFTVNNKYTNQVNLYCDEDNNFIIGERIEIDLPELFTQGNFIITDISESKEGNSYTQYTIQMRNTNLLENYIDLFRSSTDIEEQESQIEVEYVVEYAEDEAIKEIHEVDFYNANNHTLNFNL